MGGRIKGIEDHRHAAPAEPLDSKAWQDVRHLYSVRVQGIVDRIAERDGLTYLDLLLMCVADYHAMGEQIADLLTEDKTSSAVATLTAARIQSHKLAKSLVAEINPDHSPNTKRHPEPAAMAERRKERRKRDSTDTGDELVN